jgi:hypothetical protein
MAAAPYPLAGEARDVVADVKRLGGLGVVAHPDSEKPALRWSAWDTPFDAVEWLNADSEWRDEPGLRLTRAVLQFPWRQSETLASLFDRPEATLARWDDQTKTRRIVAIAGTDAHARIGLWGRTDPYGPGADLEIPSYEASFRTFAIRVGLDSVLSGNASHDAAAVLAGLRSGRLYTAIDALAHPPQFDFHAEAQGMRAEMGDRFEPAGLVRLVVAVSHVQGLQVVLFQNGRILESTERDRLEEEVEPFPAVYRVEVLLEGGPGLPPIPWIVSNPIYIGAAPQAVEETPVEARETRWLRPEGTPSRWTIERDPASVASFAADAPASADAGLAFTLGSGPAAFAALRHRLSGDQREFSRVVLRAWSERPRRVSIQLRAPVNEPGARWRRSIYLDEHPREHVIRVDDLQSVEGRRSPRPEDVRLADSILVVVDAVNTRPGEAGTIWLGQARVER